MAKKTTNESDAGAERAAPPEAASHLVVMRKHGEEIAVHPSCVAAHRAAGWVEA